MVYGKKDFAKKEKQQQQHGNKKEMKTTANKQANKQTNKHYNKNGSAFCKKGLLGKCTYDGAVFTSCFVISSSL